jgi:hypothetical protein
MLLLDLFLLSGNLNFRKEKVHATFIPFHAFSGRIFLHRQNGEQELYYGGETSR